MSDRVGAATRAELERVRVVALPFRDSLNCVEAFLSAASHALAMARREGLLLR